MAAKQTLRPGKAYPLGATWDRRGVNFALFSENAEKVELCLFDGRGEHELQRIPLPEYTDQVWHGYLAGARAGLLYGYRVYGPYHPERGHRFNPNKLLIDPYAVALLGELQPLMEALEIDEKEAQSYVDAAKEIPELAELDVPALAERMSTDFGTLMQVKKKVVGV